MRIVLTLAVLLLATGRLFSAEPPSPEQLKASARTFVETLLKGDFTAASKDFDATMKEKLPPDKLEETWKGLNKQLGKLQKFGEARYEKSAKYQYVSVPCVFEKLTLDARITYTAEGQVTGLFFRPGGAGEYQLPAYAKPDRYREIEVTVGSGEWALPGTLTIPKGEGPFPAVVLVHGSGPLDRDETIGPNRPFRDLALGLASRGIAVLRYEKRTHQYGPQLAKRKNEITVKDEVIDDAVAALDLLAARKEIKPKGIYILGHSLGAMMAPRIAEASPRAAGIILLAAPARPLEDVILDQITWITSLEKDEDGAKRLEELKRQVAHVKDPQLAPDAPSKDLPLGIPPRYWLALRGPQPTEIAARLHRPIYVLQGERDYQVTTTDLRLWVDALSGRPQATVKGYPRLNHLFMEGVGKAKPEEYQKVGHVSAEVIDDIADWVSSYSGAKPR